MFEHAVHHTVKDGAAGESHHTPERLTEGWRVSWRCSCEGGRGGREDEDVCVGVRGGQEWEGGERKYRMKNCRYFQLTCDLILNTSSPDFLSMHILRLRVEWKSVL